MYGILNQGDSYILQALWLCGLLNTAAVWSLLDDSFFVSSSSVKPNTIAGTLIGGFLVGLGTKLGSGCTSGTYILVVSVFILVQAFDVMY